MADKTLVTIEMRFVTDGSTEPIADRIRESVALIVGRGALEDFKVRSMPLAPRKGTDRSI
jgi:hypothetical protein